MNPDSVYLTEAVPSGTVQTALPCKRCGGTMQAGIAIEQTYAGIPDFPGDGHVCTVSPAGPGRVIDCMKCENCGWSVTNSVPGTCKPVMDCGEAGHDEGRCGNAQCLNQGEKR